MVSFKKQAEEKAQKMQEEEVKKSKLLSKTQHINKNSESFVPKVYEKKTFDLKQEGEGRKKETNCTFNPDISTKSRQIKRDKSIDARLYEDALQRKEKQQSQQIIEILSGREASKEVAKSALTPHSTQLALQKVKKEIWESVQEYEQVSQEDFAVILKKLEYLPQFF